jgi:hypothetical protein
MRHEVARRWIRRKRLVVTTLGRQATVDLLQMVDQFGSCTREQLHEVARLAERVRVSEGEVLAREGRIGREFFLILSGSVGVTQRGGRVNTLGAGDFFGELAAINPGPRNATVTALTDLDVLIIGPREFAAMADIPGFRDQEVARPRCPPCSARQPRARWRPAGGTIAVTFGSSTVDPPGSAPTGLRSRTVRRFGTGVRTGRQ